MGIYQACTVHDIMRLGLHALCCLAAQPRLVMPDTTAHAAIVSGMIYHMQIVSGRSTFQRGGVGLSSTDTPTQTVFCIRHTSISHPTHMKHAVQENDFIP